MRRRTGVVVAATLLVIGLAAVPLSFDPHATGAIRRTPDGRVADDLVARWERWRRTTATYTEVTVRQSPSARLTQQVTVAQRFPDLVVRDGDDISARIGSRLLGCHTADGAPVCVDNGGYRPDDELRSELDRLRSLVVGPDATYHLASLGRGCFAMAHVGRDPLPSHGDREQWCFDDRTGVVVEEVRVVGDLTITTRRDDVRTDVDPAAFALSAPGA